MKFFTGLFCLINKLEAALYILRTHKNNNFKQKGNKTGGRWMVFEMIRRYIWM